jgi:dihydroorotate dehydrogenase electron transfer subunit
MQPSYSKNKVVENIITCGNIYKLTVRGNFDVKPGQFYNLRAWDTEPLLSRPISIYDKSEDTISFLYEVRGVGTKILSNLKPEDEIELLGPLGNGFEVDNIKGRIAVVVGGIGIAPLLYTVKNLKNSEIDLFAGFREKSYSIDEFRPYVNNVKLATDFGTEEHRGFVTDIFNPMEYDQVLCCGPEIMMRKVAKMCQDCGVKVLISMESHMACGVGACLVCTCKTKDGMKRTCKDGPIFHGEDVI